MTWKKDMKNMKNMKNNTKNIEALYERLKISVFGLQCMVIFSGYSFIEQNTITRKMINPLGVEQSKSCLI